VTARIYETRMVQREGVRVAVPTGVLYEIRMTRELPLRPDGRPQYADFMPARDLMVPMAEKAMAVVDQTGGMWRRAPGDAGYTGINNGTEPPDWAQVLTMWTGKPARTFSVHDTADPVAFMRTIQKFREADLPVVTGTRQREEYIRAGNDHFVRVGYTREGNPIELLAPYYISPRHAYGVSDVDGERLLLHNPYGAFLHRPGEKVIVPEPDGGPLRHPGFLVPEGIPVDEHLWDVFPSRYWAALDGTGLVHAEQRAFEDALGRAGVHEVPPGGGELAPGPEPTGSAAQARDLFRQLEQHALTTTDPLGHAARSVPWIGAADRADEMARKLAEWGYAPRKIFAVGPDLKLAPRTMPDWVPRLPMAGRARGEVQYNAGVLIRAADEHGNGLDMVLDPLTADRPVTIGEWLGRMGISQNGYRMFDAAELDQPGKAAFDRTIGDYFLKAADHQLYDDRAIIYTASPETRYPFAGAQYFGREQSVSPMDAVNFRLNHPVRGYDEPPGGDPAARGNAPADGRLNVSHQTDGYALDGQTPVAATDRSSGSALAAGDAPADNGASRARAEEIQAYHPRHSAPEVRHPDPAGSALAGRQSAHHGGAQAAHPDHVEVDATHPALPRDSRFKFGEPRDIYGQEIPVFDGEPAPGQVMQGAIGDCGMIATIRAVARRFPDAIKNAVTENPDGSVTVRLHETTVSDDGKFTEPTGRIIELRMEPDLPVKPNNPGSPAFANVRRGKALWGGLLEKGVAGVDKTWSDARASLNAKWFPKFADDRGYARLNRGSFPSMRAELLTQLTGERARTVSGSNVTECARIWKQLLDEGKPVIGASLSDTLRAKRGGEPNAYDLVSSHVHEIVDVIEGPNGFKDGYVVLSNPWGRKDPQPIPIWEMGKYLSGTVSTLGDRPPEGAS
jgi:hypothetical protein